jgi:hypothetical protein
MGQWYAEYCSMDAGTIVLLDRDAMAISRGYRLTAGTPEAKVIPESRHGRLLKSQTESVCLAMSGEQ